VKKLFLPVLTVALILSLSGCWSGRALLVFERPYWDGIDGNLRLRASLVVHALGRGYLPRLSLVEAPAEPVARLVTELSRHRYATAVVGPLLAEEWQSFTPKFPRTRFLLVDGEIPETDQPPNVILLGFDRGVAFRAAGFAAGHAVQEKFGGAQMGTLGPHIGVLVASMSDLSASETDAFSAGVAEALDGALPVLTRMPASVDRAAAVNTVKKMSRDGADIILLGMGSLNPWCLEALKDVGGAAVVADWASSGAFPHQVFLSVEEDVVSGIDRGLAALMRGARSVNGPVRIVTGLARAVPAAARARVEGR
jgi:basic membrane lipoprotein Med (substrate-binding protein (PBP1-ABC) superfamily)